MLRRSLMKSGAFIIALSIIMAHIAGCQRIVTEYSEKKTEPAVVEDVIFTPSLHGSGVGPTFTGEGDVGITFTSVNIPEKYAVVFRCQHGKFVIQGTGEKYKKLWEHLVRNQEVTVHYKEIYRVTYDGDEVLSRELIDYDFLDAK